MSIIRFVMNEKALRMAEKENKIVAIVDMKLNKNEIKRLIEKTYGLKIEKINTLITSKGEKKAMIKLTKEFSAIDFYAKIGLI
ncbi:MAG: 50S ribosomal protein L23 [Thermoproteota archaeon]|jgi:large subunit ribosomal protein L23|nr:50S ribosomal protein L23 [Thermoproteota archaeon]